MVAVAAAMVAIDNRSKIDRLDRGLCPRQEDARCRVSKNAKK